MPEPVREPLCLGEVYYMPSLICSQKYDAGSWTNSMPGSLDMVRLEKGIIHLTKDAAIAHSEAMLKLLKN